jgi:uncharacterized protein YegP (UPF0339 family)
MAGIFELFVDAESYFRFRLTAPDGTVMAVSRAFDDKPAAVAGIAATREYAGMGLISDLSRTPTRPDLSAAAARAGSVLPAGEDRRVSSGDLRTRARALRRAAAGPRWAGAA